jgi:hypothetical protein
MDITEKKQKQAANKWISFRVMPDELKQVTENAKKLHIPRSKLMKLALASYIQMNFVLLFKVLEHTSKAETQVQFTHLRAVRQSVCPFLFQSI